MKVGFLLDDTLDVPDGVQQYVLTLGRWLEQTGHEVRYLVADTKRSDVNGVYSLARLIKLRFNGNVVRTPRLARGSDLQAVIDKEKFDVIHVQLPCSPLFAARLIKRLPQAVAVVGTVHIVPYSRREFWASKALALMLSSTLRRLDAVCSVSQPAADFVKQVFGQESQVVPNVVATRRFSATKPTKNNDKHLLFLGRLVERKGPLLLLQALERVDSAIYQGWRITIAGSGPLLPRLKSYARRHKLPVEFSGFIDEADKPALLASADIAVFPSTSGESFGIVLVEAMAASHGVVLAGNNPGYASVMAPLPDQLIEPRDTATFGACLADWMMAPAEQRTAAAAKQRQLASDYDVNSVGQQIIAIYTKAIAHRKKA